MAFFILFLSNLVIPTTAAFSENRAATHVRLIAVSSPGTTASNSCKTTNFQISRSLLFNGITLHNNYYLEVAQCKGIRILEREILACGIWNLGKFSLGSPESLVLESRIQLKESGIPLAIGIQNPSSTDKDWNPLPGIWNQWHGIQNPGLSWIPLHEVIKVFRVFTNLCRGFQDFFSLRKLSFLFVSTG